MEPPQSDRCRWCGDLILRFKGEHWMHGDTLAAPCRVWEKGTDEPFATPRLYEIQEEPWLN